MYVKYRVSGIPKQKFPRNRNVDIWSEKGVKTRQPIVINAFQPDVEWNNSPEGFTQKQIVENDAEN